MEERGHPPDLLPALTPHSARGYEALPEVAPVVRDLERKARRIPCGHVVEPQRARLRSRRECLQAADVERVLAVGRTATPHTHPKLEELVHPDFTSFEAVGDRLAGWDACFFCAGTTAAGRSEADYRRITYDFTLALAKVLARVSPGLTFVFVSGAGTDGSEKGRSMWARVKGETENALLRLPFREAVMFRPGYIKPVHGERSKTPLYQSLYAATGWMFPVLRRLVPRHVTTTEEVARAMLRVAREGAPGPVLENEDIVRLGVLQT